MCGYDFQLLGCVVTRSNEKMKLLQVGYNFYCKRRISLKLRKEELNILYDSKCSLCIHEINFLARRDLHGKLLFTDLEDLNYDPKLPENGKVNKLQLKICKISDVSIF